VTARQTEWSSTKAGVNLTADGATALRNFQGGLDGTLYNTLHVTGVFGGATVAIQAKGVGTAFQTVASVDGTTAAPVNFICKGVEWQLLVSGATGTTDLAWSIL